MSRNLERVADLATNIGEDVVFLVEGRSIKHHAEDRGEARQSPAARAGDRAGERLAAIDVGSNTILLTDSRLRPATGLTTIEEAEDQPRLGAGLRSSGRLDERAMERAMASLVRMRDACRRLKVGRPGDSRDRRGARGQDGDRVCRARTDARYPASNHLPGTLRPTSPIGPPPTTSLPAGQRWSRTSGVAASS